MKVIRLSIGGVVSARPTTYKLANGQGSAYAFHHGECGRGRWQVRLPLGTKSFPFFGDDKAPEAEQEYKLVKLDGRKDAKGNQLYLLGEGDNDGSVLVMWDLSPGFRGGASYKIEGDATLLAEGSEAQGIAGRMGGASCPVVLARSSAVLKWTRSGRLYGSPASWIARFDGVVWTVVKESDDALQASLAEV